MKFLEKKLDREALRQELSKAPKILWDDIKDAIERIKSVLQDNDLTPEKKLDYIKKLIEYIEPRLDIIMG